MSTEAKAGALALLVHAAFLLLLVFGVSWQTEQPEPVMVDLWQTLPDQPTPTPIPTPAVQKPKPAPPIKEPPPKPVVKDIPSPKAPDIALEKKKRDAEQIVKKKQAELEEKLLLKKEREVAEKLKQREAQILEERALQRRMMEEDLARESRQLKQLAARGAAQRRSSEVSGIVAQYQNEIKAKIRSNTRVPENLKGNPQVKFEIRLLPTGEVIGVKQTQSSGVPAWDDAVERAIQKSSPLPLPTEKDARAKFVPSFVSSHRPRD